MPTFRSLALLLLLVPTLAQAGAQKNRRGDEAFLDAPYRNLRHPRVSFVIPADEKVLPSNPVPVVDVIKKQTPVKMQAARGSCSIFSATALLESLLVIQGKADTSLDLSEEYLQYLIAQYMTNDGSSSPGNFRALRQYGTPSEAKMPYIGFTWASLDDDGARARCGHLTGAVMLNCLTGHRDPGLLAASESVLTNPDSLLYDPAFLEARKEAEANRALFFSSAPLDDNSMFDFGGVLASTADIKAQLDKGIPVTLDLSFYYGSWNHRLTTELGISRNLDAWAKGIVSFPEEGSLDLAKSSEKPAGHSVVVVGYDDEKEVTYTIPMEDGTNKTFTRKGVYYFKNSWGTSGFGADFELNGEKFPGFGMITQDYANQHGQFYQLVL